MRHHLPDGGTLLARPEAPNSRRPLGDRALTWRNTRVKAFVLASMATLALIAAAAQTGSAQWRATAWTLDFKNDTDMCIALSVGAEGDPPLYRRDVWAHRAQHFDDNHTTLMIHAKVYEKLDCSGPFVADLHDSVHQLRNHITVTKDGKKFAWHREQTEDAPNYR